MAALHAHVFTVPRPWSAAEFAALLADPLVFALTDSGGVLIGRAVAGEAEVLTLAVAPEARRQGIGGRLLTGFLDRARGLGCERAFLEVAVGNGAAIALYSRAGFRESGRRKGYFAGPDGQRQDALVLALLLDAGAISDAPPALPEI